MYKDKSNQFLDGDLDLKNFSNPEDETSVEQDFVKSYNKLIDKKNEEVPDFNPFEKLEQHQKQRFLQKKRLLAYAASVLLVASLLFVGFKHNFKQKQLTVTEHELTELQEKTKLALWHFSNEMNTCLANLEDAKKVNAPLNEVQSLRNINIQFENPIKDLKIN